MTARASAREARFGHAGFGQHEEAAVLHDKTDAFGPLAVGPADVGVAVSEFQSRRSPHEQRYPAALVMNRLEQSASHRTGRTQIVLLFQQTGGAWQILVAHSHYFQLPEHHGRRVLGKHAFEFRVHFRRN